MGKVSKAETTGSICFGIIIALIFLLEKMNAAAAIVIGCIMGMILMITCILYNMHNKITDIMLIVLSTVAFSILAYGLHEHIDFVTVLASFLCVVFIYFKSRRIEKGRTGR